MYYNELHILISTRKELHSSAHAIFLFLPFISCPYFFSRCKKKLQLVRFKDIRLPTQNLEKMLRNHSTLEDIFSCIFDFTQQINISKRRGSMKEKKWKYFFLSFSLSFIHTYMHACTHTETFCKLKWVWTSLRIISQLLIFHFCGDNEINLKRLTTDCFLMSQN